MPDRLVGVTDEPAGAGVAEYRVRERTVGGATVAEQYLLLRRERVRSFIGMAATFRTAGSPTHAAAIWNADGSDVLVAVLNATFWKAVGSQSSNLVLMRFSRTTTAPSGGALIIKVSVGTGSDSAETSSASVEVRSAATADGTGTGLTVTETGRVAHLGQPGRLVSDSHQYAPFDLGWPVDPTSLTGTHELLDGMDAHPMVILRPGEGLVAATDTTSSVAFVGANLLWEEYTLP